MTSPTPRQQLSIELLPLLLSQSLPVFTTANLDLPVVGTQQGNLFHGRYDEHVRWYLETVSLAADPDPSFAFAATQRGAGADQSPFEQARLTLGLSIAEGPELAAARTGDPTLVFQPVVLSGRAVTIALPYTAADGTAKTALVAGTIDLTGAPVAVFDLPGPQVIQAYEALTHPDVPLVVTVTTNYACWQDIQYTSWVPDPPAPNRWGHRFELEATALNQSADSTRALSTTSFVQPPDPPEAEQVQVVQLPMVRVQPLSMAGDPTQLAVTDRLATVLPLGHPETTADYLATAGMSVTLLDVTGRFYVNTYRGAFTLAAEGTARPIVDANDLTSFASARSEYRELTSLGPVSARYPTLRRLYYGQVSGTVLALPAAYGLVRSSGGLAARCDAVLDPSSTSSSQCRFQFSFIVAPVVSPIELAQLSADLLGCPEAKGRTLRLALPEGLDERHAAGALSVGGLPAVLVEGTDVGTFILTLDVADAAAVPAVTTANLLLSQLGASGPPPLVVSLAVRLDDSYPEPVATTIALNVHQTAGSDDVALTLSSDIPPKEVLLNRGPVSLTVQRCAVIVPGGVVVTNLGGVAIASRESISLNADVPASATAVVVERTLLLPQPFTTSAIGSYIEIHATNMQDVQHPLTINASALNLTNTVLSVSLTLDGLPGIPVPNLSLEAGHVVATAHVLVPVGVLLSGLATTLVVSITHSGESRDIVLHNDFLDEPILVLTSTALATPTPQ